VRSVRRTPSSGSLRIHPRPRINPARGRTPRPDGQTAKADVVERPFQNKSFVLYPGCLKTITIGLRPRRAIVESSVPVIWNAPSPTNTRVRRLGLAICAPSAQERQSHGGVEGGGKKLAVFMTFRRWRQTGNRRCHKPRSCGGQEKIETGDEPRKRHGWPLTGKSHFAGMSVSLMQRVT